MTVHPLFIRMEVGANHLLDLILLSLGQRAVSALSYGVADLASRVSVLLSQQMKNVPPQTIPIRSPTWRRRPVKRTLSTAPATPSSRAWVPPIGQSQPSGRPACMPAPCRPASPCPAWRTLAATPGPACPRTAAARSPPCSPWTGYPISTSLLTSPRGPWSPGWLAWRTTAPRSSERECSSTRPPWPTSLWSGSAGLRLASSPPAAFKRQSSCTLTACQGPCPRISTTRPCTESAWSQSGMTAAKARPTPSLLFPEGGERGRGTVAGRTPRTRCLISPHVHVCT